MSNLRIHVWNPFAITFSDHLPMCRLPSDNMDKASKCFVLIGYDIELHSISYIDALLPDVSRRKNCRSKSWTPESYIPTWHHGLDGCGAPSKPQGSLGKGTSLRIDVVRSCNRDILTYIEVLRMKSATAMQSDIILSFALYALHLYMCITCYDMRVSMDTKSWMRPCFLTLSLFPPGARQLSSVQL